MHAQIRDVDYGHCERPRTTDDLVSFDENWRLLHCFRYFFFGVLEREGAADQERNKHDDE